MSKLNSSYRIIPEQNLVLEYHTGVLKVEDYIRFKKALLNDPLFKANLNHFIHHKNVIFKTTPTEISKFVDFIKTNVKSFGHRKVAILTKTPNQVVSTTLYKMMQKNTNQTVEVFSTNENALIWLGIPKSKLLKLIDLILDLPNQ